MEAPVTRPIRIAHLTTVDLTLRFILLGQLRYLRREGFEVAALSAPGPWVPSVEAEGIRHIPWPHATRAWDPAADVRAFYELLRILRQERFDLVHTHTPKAGIMGRVAARIVGVPCVVSSIHGFYTLPEDPPTKRLPVLALERMAARLSDLELYDSEEDLAWARRIGVVKVSKSLFLGNGVDLRRFDPSGVPAHRVAALREELGIPQEAQVVGAVGRLVAEKGYRELFAAAREVRKANPNTRFVVLGAPDREKADVIQEEEIERAKEDVIFAGWVDDVRDLLALMDVFVLPSWREGQPVSAIEAAAMGKPLVLTDIRGCREVARDGVEGLLVPPRDAERLAEVIARLVGDEALRDRLGKAARERAVTRFDEDKIAGRLVALYGKLLARKRVFRPTERPAGNSVRIRRARVEDAPALARIHREALPGGFLSSLGDRFLRRLYFALAADQDAVAFVAEDGNGVAGFATGVGSVRGFYRRFYIRHGIPAMLAVVPHLLRRGTVHRLRETRRYPDTSKDLPDSELLSIAVDGRFRSQGVGRQLAARIIEGLAERGAGEIKVVVGAENEGANRFYVRMGFEHRANIFVHDGTASNVLVFRCSSSSPSDSRSY
jgi:glycosyltransferase involved in cell wall biosynthesis/ribosomal protein S18 acetylase RimI-like enzyme